jgi:hypothetical protein
VSLSFIKNVCMKQALCCQCLLHKYRLHCLKNESALCSRTTHSCSTFHSLPTSEQQLQMAYTAPEYSTQKLHIRADPYALAYRYSEYLAEHPKRMRDEYNPYYKSLLANQPDPRVDSTTDRARAIRYAKENYECFYELRDIKHIVEWLDKNVSPTSYTNTENHSSNNSNSTEE